MNMQSHYGELAIDLLCGQIERSESQTQTNCYVHTFAHAERNDHSVTCVLGTTNLGTHQYIQKPFTNTLEGSQNTEQFRKQNTPQKSCTELAAESHFAGFSKDVFQCRPPTNFWGYLAEIFAPPKQENSAEYVKSVHGQFSKMQSRQDVPISCRAGSVGGYVSREFGYFIWLLMQLRLSNTFAQFDHSVQG